MFREDSRVEHWEGTDRSDGVKIVYSQRRARWEIDRGNGSERITMCPCCEKVFPMARAAKLAANQLFPLIDADQGIGEAEHEAI